MTALPLSVVVLRLALAAILGALIGIDRERREKPAGMRTMALVSLGAAGFTLASPFESSEAISRVVQGVITGVGFLGAGSIIRDRSDQTVHGLTTAASIWVAAGVGTACGLGLWVVALATAALAMFVLILDPVERWIRTRR